MPNVTIYKTDGTQAGQITLNDDIFGAEINESAMHQVVVAQLANKRQGTQSTLTRSEVRGGGIKPWRQKGTGRARQGSIRAHQWTKALSYTHLDVYKRQAQCRRPESTFCWHGR